MLVLFLLALLSGYTYSQEPDDSAPPPLKLLSKSERTELNAKTEPKERTVLGYIRRGGVGKEDLDRNQMGGSRVSGKAQRKGHAELRALRMQRPGVSGAHEKPDSRSRAQHVHGDPVVDQAAVAREPIEAVA